MTSEPSIFYYIAFVTLQAFLISLKQKRYGTDAGETQVQFNHGSLSAFMSNSNSPVWPPVGSEGPQKNIKEYYHMILTCYMEMIYS